MVFIKKLFILAFVLGTSMAASAQNITQIRAALSKSKLEVAKKSNTGGNTTAKTTNNAKVIFAYVNVITDLDCKIVFNKEIFDIKVGETKKIPVYQENSNYSLLWEEKYLNSENAKLEFSPADKGKTKQLNLKAKEIYKILEKRSEDDNLLAGIISRYNDNSVAISIDENTQMGSPTLKDFEINKYEVTVFEFATYKHFNANTNDNKSSSNSLVVIPNGITTDKEYREGIDWSCNAVGAKHNNESEYRNPVVNVSWEEANGFCQWLSQNDKNYVYRLPNSEEWLYAASCSFDNTYGEYPWNINDPIQELANIADASLAKSIKYKKEDILTNVNDNAAFTTIVGSYQPNCFGLYDMGGNVAEWCGDDFLDTKSLDKSVKKTYRGGSYYSNPDKCKLNRSFGLSPQQRHSGIGFRVLRQVK